MRKSGHELQILILMAGRGSRVSSEGLPKPLVKIHGRPLWEIVTRNLNLPGSRFIYIIRDEDCANFQLDEKILSNNPEAQLVKLKEITDGAARSALMGQDFLDLEKPLLIANSDQYFNSSLSRLINRAQDGNVDGLIMTMKASGPKWSYVQADESNKVSMVREKVQISDTATVGLYYFKRAQDFVEGAKRMIEKDIRTNNEFYLAPVYNELIEQGKNIFHISYGDHGKDVFGLGTSEDIETFHKIDGSKKMLKSLFS